MKVKDAVEILARRRKFLEDRASTLGPDKQSFDLAEASALELALHAIKLSGPEAQNIVVAERMQKKAMKSVLLSIYDFFKDGESALDQHERIFDDTDETVLQRIERVLTEAGAIQAS